jgi:UDP-2,3-diacylglucosamine hydrolase
MTPELAIPARRAAFVADAHLDADDAHARAFLRLAEEALEEDRALFLLGDVFDLWFGTDALTFRFQRPVVERLRSLRREGLRAYYVEGNRDFFLKRPYEGDLFESVAEESMRVRIGGLPAYLSHGDTVNRADLAYRFWKALSKNRLAFGLASLLPPSVVLPLADRVEKRLKPTNPRFKGKFPEAEIVAFADRAFAAGSELVVLGHFHTEYRLDRRVGESLRTLAVLPCWKEAHRALLLEESGEVSFRALPAAAR